ncbi:glycosyltransferase family 2 protein [Candidatus Microgenomates bacterium]|nr:glycosyltransferase family 2 protein [Candidatus Microgenomates bacterium]
MNISVIILTKNAAEKLTDCLESAKDLGEIIILDAGSTDKTLEIAKKYGTRIFKQKAGSYDTWRNQGKEVAKSEWLFYIDPDERVTLELREEISRRVLPRGSPTAIPPGNNSGAPSVGLPAASHPSPAAFAIPRRNFVFGKELRHGGWYPDYVIRLIKKDKLIRWEGELHEQPKIEGEIGYLKNAFIHLKEDNLEDMIKKTNKWSEIEAKLLYDSGHPKMTWWRFVRPVVSEVWGRLILKLGFLDGTAGIIFSFYQGYSVFARYAKLWEMQQQKN